MNTGRTEIPANDARSSGIEHPIHPGDTCPTCTRRVPYPRKETSPTTKPIAYRAPLDEYDAHLEVIDAVAELLGVKQEKYHRFKAISYACAAVLQQGLRIDVDLELLTPFTDEICRRCRGEAVHTHHRKMRSQGGDNSEANLVRLCVECHDWVHRNPAEAYATGYLVKSWQNPEEVPVGG